MRGADVLGSGGPLSAIKRRNANQCCKGQGRFSCCRRAGTPLCSRLGVPANSSITLAILACVLDHLVDVGLRDEARAGADVARTVHRLEAVRFEPRLELRGRLEGSLG